MSKEPNPIALSPWDERYSSKGFYYGSEPNDFLREHANQIPLGGKVLCLAEGEGRNAVFLATLGHQVIAVDGSSVGLKKMDELAAKKGVSVGGVVSDLSKFKIKPGAWNGIASIWCHLPRDLRGQVHRACVQGLKSGGLFILEAYRPKQLEYATGGPSSTELLMTLEDLKRELTGLEFLTAQEIEREIHEGKGHNGRSAVVQVIGHKA